MLLQLSKYDFVFIHREASPLGPPIFEFLIAKIWKKRIIYDFDDAIWLPNTSQENKIAAILKWNNKVKSICKWSWKISCGNEYLADYARQYNRAVYVVPTVVDTEKQHYPRQKKRDNSKIVIGWTGSHSTLVYLKELIPVFQYLEKQFPNILEFIIIANKNPHPTLKNYTFIEWNKATEIEDLSKLNIGVMPLTDNQWTRGKCGFKAIQYMALGIPALVTPVAVNQRIVEHGKEGYHCKNIEEWRDRLEQLIQNPLLRIEMGVVARKKIVSHYSTKAVLHSFMDLFK